MRFCQKPRIKNLFRLQISHRAVLAPERAGSSSSKGGASPAPGMSCAGRGEGRGRQLAAQLCWLCPMGKSRIQLPLRCHGVARIPACMHACARFGRGAAEATRSSLGQLLKKNGA